MEEINFEHLNYLLQAPSKAALISLCDEAFKNRHGKVVPTDLITTTSLQLTIKFPQASQLMISLRGLIHNAVFQGSVDVNNLCNLFPESFHTNLRDLLVKVFVERLPQWKSQCSNDTISLPRLVDFDWRVDAKTSSDHVTMPTCLVNLKIQKPSNTSEEDNRRDVTVELSRETLDAMLDGLGKIRDQLSSVSQK